LLISSVLFGLVLAVLRKGDLRRLGLVKFRLWWLIVASFALKLAVVRLSSSGVEWMISYGPALHLVAYGMLLSPLLLNRDLPWMKLALLGTGLNFAVVAANGGQMPVFEDSLVLIGKLESLARLQVATDATHTIATANTALAWLGDWIPIPLPLSAVGSPGDIFLALSVILFTNTVTQPSYQYHPRHGLAG